MLAGGYLGVRALTCDQVIDPDERHRWDRVVKNREATIEELAPGFKSSILHRHVLTPWDLEKEYGLTEGNIFHGDLRLDQLFFMRPIPGWSQYRTPIDGLYLCGAGAHPGGGVTGAPGHNAAHQALRDWKKGRFRRASHRSRNGTGGAASAVQQQPSKEHV